MDASTSTYIDDVESGSAPMLSPLMEESPERRKWALIRKVYLIVTFQLLLTSAVAYPIATYQPILHFLTATWAGWRLFIVIDIVIVLILFLMCVYQEKQPINYLLLGLFSVCLSFPVGVSSAYTHGKVVLEAIILTASFVISSTIYTFWGARSGNTYTIWVAFLIFSCDIVVVSPMIQIYYPLGSIRSMVYVVLGAIVLSSYIIFDTWLLIKTYTYDAYITAALQFYVDIVNIFVSLFVLIFGAFIWMWAHS